MLIHTEQQQTIPGCVPSCGFHSGSLVSLFRRGTRRERVPHSVSLPCAWQALSLQKLHVAPHLLKCKFEKHYRGGKHQHISHIKAGRLEDCVISQVSNCAQAWWIVMWSKSMGNKPTSLVHSTRHHSPFFHHNCLPISVIAFDDKVRERRRKEKQQKMERRTGRENKTLTWWGQRK